MDRGRRDAICIRCAGLVLCLLFAVAAPAATIHKIGIGHGLDARVVSSVLVDRQGFLWVGSREGLFRFDGDQVEVFKPDLTQPGSITSPDIRTLYEDHEGTLWVGNNTGGLSRFEPVSRRFETWRHDPADPQSLPSDNVFSIVNDNGGYLWVGTRNGLGRLDPESGRFEDFSTHPEVAGALPHDLVYELARDSKGRLWVGTRNSGIGLLDPDSLRYHQYDIASALNDLPDFNIVYSLLPDIDGYVWAGTRVGLVRLDPDSGTATQIPLGETDHTVAVPALERGEDGVIWVGTLERGLLRIDSQTLEVDQISREGEAEDKALPVTGILDLATTAEGLLLVGTWGKGVYGGLANTPSFKLLGGEDARPGIQAVNTTALIPSTEAGHVWVGSFADGLRILDTRDLSLAAWPGVPDGIDQLLVTSLAADNAGRLYLGSSNGLWLIDRNTGKWEHHGEQAPPEGDIALGFVNALWSEADGELWVGVGGGGLFHRPPGETSFVEHVNQPNDPQSLSGNYITTLLVEDRDSIWVGTRSNGLNHCRRKPWVCTRYGSGDEGRATLGHFNVTALIADPDGNLWVGTDGGGIHRLSRDPAGQVTEVERWTEREGLVNDGVMGLALDGATLWVTTRHGLSLLDTRNGTLVSYVEKTGLPAVSFNANSALVSGSHVLLGAKEGLLVSPRGQTLKSPPPAPVRLTHLEVIGESSGPAEAPLANNRLSVPYGTPLSISFAILDYLEIPKEYAYRTNETANWTPLGTRNQITFSGLEPGRHELVFRGRSTARGWSESEPFYLTVVPPLWMEPWFRLCLVATLLLTALGAYRVRTAALRRRNRELEALQNQLSGAYSGLRRLTASLESAKDAERSRISAELHDDLGQTLTAAKINLELAAASMEHGAPEQRIEDTLKMLDSMIAKVRDISLLLRPPLLEEAGLVSALRSHLDTVSERTDIPVRFEADPAIDSLPPELNMVLFRFVQEAVSNALRHASASRIDVALTADDEYWVATIGDDGRGFDIEAVRSRLEHGEHLGLLGMSERVNSAGGHFDIESTPGEGTRVTASIPR